MKGTKYLSELITDPDTILPGKINIIEANTSGGKTYFALTTLLQWAGSPEKMLYLIDTTNGELRLQQNIITIDRGSYAFANYAPPDPNRGKFWGELIFDTSNKMPVMTYAGFGAEIRRSGKPFWKQYEYIVCDEIQNLIKYQKLPNSGTYLIDAENTLRSIAAAGKTKIVALSATPQKARQHFGSLCYDVPFAANELISFENQQVKNYTGIQGVLLQSVGKTGILFTQQIRDMKQYIAFANANGIRANGFWSINTSAQKRMTADQYELRQKVLEEETIPADIDLLVINSASETCIKIQAQKRKVDYMIIHTTNPETQTQVRGRYCGDLPLLYLHSNVINPADIEVPAQFLNKKLFSQEKDELCQILNLRAPNGVLHKWGKVKGFLTQGNYDVKEDREQNKRYALILPK